VRNKKTKKKKSKRRLQLIHNSHIHQQEIHVTRSMTNWVMEQFNQQTQLINFLYYKLANAVSIKF